MYKIELFYQSDMKGIYTKEEETANTMLYAQVKVMRMIERWAKNLAIVVPDKYNFVRFKCNNLSDGTHMISL